MPPQSRLVWITPVTMRTPKTVARTCLAWVLKYLRTPLPSTGYARAEYQRSGSWDADVVEVQGGYRYSFYSRDSVSVSGRVGVGVASADIDAYRNTNQFVTLPLAVEVGYRPTEKFEVYGRAGYKWAFDVTSDNTCRDGSGSNSSGRGTCSWHGGVSHRSDKVGTVHGPTLNVGVRYNF